MLNLSSKKKALSILVAAVFVTPTTIFAINRINSMNDTYAVTMPSGFNDQNFYNCVLSEFQREFPNETIGADGLTDEQLSKIVTLPCSGSNKNDSEKVSNTSGIEKMSALKMVDLHDNKISEINLRYNLTSLVTLYLNGNNLTFLDLSGNPAVASLHVDDIFVRTTLINPKSVLPHITYDLSGVPFLKSITQTIGGQNESYDWDTGILTISNYEHNYVQVSADNNIENFKLQLPLFMELDKNGGTGNTFLPICYTAAGAEKCSVGIPDINLPNKEGRDCKGYADSASATEATYLPGETVEVSAPKIAYAVYESGSPDSDPDSDPDRDPDTDHNSDSDSDSSSNSTSDSDDNDDGDKEIIDVPNTSGKLTPNTGGNTKTDEGNTNGFVYALPVVAIFIMISLYVHRKAKLHKKFKW